MLEIRQVSEKSSGFPKVTQPVGGWAKNRTQSPWVPAFLHSLHKVAWNQDSHNPEKAPMPYPGQPGGLGLYQSLLATLAFRPWPGGGQPGWTLRALKRGPILQGCRATLGCAREELSRVQNSCGQSFYVQAGLVPGPERQQLQSSEQPCSCGVTTNPLYTWGYQVLRFQPVEQRGEDSSTISFLDLLSPKHSPSKKPTLATASWARPLLLSTACFSLARFLSWANVVVAWCGQRRQGGTGVGED